MIASNPDLLERDLIKQQQMADGFSSALHQRGVNPDIADLAARVGIHVFRTAYRQWRRCASRLISRRSADIETPRGVNRNSQREPDWRAPAELASLTVDESAVRLAVGRRAGGTEGFANSHRQALTAAGVGRVSTKAQVYDYADVNALVFLTTDVDRSRQWIRETLGALADDTASEQSLRDSGLTPIG
jgi:hypothetical protein